MLAIDHLSPDLRRFYKRVCRTFALDEHHERTLLVACESFDRAAEARARLATDGLTITTRHGEVRVHPCAAVERDSQVRALRALRELGLADERPEAPAPPRLPAARYGRAT